MNEEIYNPIWDDAGKLRDGCTIQQAMDYFKRVGMVDGTPITINGVFFTIRELMYAPGHPEILSATIKALAPGYYGNMGFKI